MKATRSYRKFQKRQGKINDLKENNARFRRVFSEFEDLDEEIREIENGNRASVPDDFLFALKLQQNCLEEEIDEWLEIDPPENIQ